MQRGEEWRQRTERDAKRKRTSKEELLHGADNQQKTKDGFETTTELPTFANSLPPDN